MAGLRQDYENWVEEEPEELNDRPSEEEMTAFEEAMKSHNEKVRDYAMYDVNLTFDVISPLFVVQFASIEHKAARLSTSLGVGKLSDKKLAPSMVGFFREGVRFAFSTDEPGYDEDLPLGARLPFLLILSK
jgi:hypothetical protein